MCNHIKPGEIEALKQYEWRLATPHTAQLRRGQWVCLSWGNTCNCFVVTNVSYARDPNNSVVLQHFSLSVNNHGAKQLTAESFSAEGEFKGMWNFFLEEVNGRKSRLYRYVYFRGNEIQTPLSATPTVLLHAKDIVKQAINPNKLEPWNKYTWNHLVPSTKINIGDIVFVSNDRTYGLFRISGIQTHEISVGLVTKSLTLQNKKRRLQVLQFTGNGDWACDLSGKINNFVLFVKK